MDFAIMLGVITLQKKELMFNLKREVLQEEDKY
jgi:hypothetical protein